jgi:uncharacterized protein YkwD
VTCLFNRVLATSIVLGVIACAGPAAPDSFARNTASTSAGAADTLTTLLDLTNAERRRAGLPDLRESRQLASAAQLQSDQMGSMGQMDHVIPGAPYPTPKDRLAAVNYAWEAYGENVAMGQRSGSEVVAAWMKSAGHRANILSPRYTELGVGVAIDAAGRPFYAEVFGRPAP